MNWLVLVLFPYFIVFTAIWIILRKGKPAGPYAGNNISYEKYFLSVLIPVKNESVNIRSLLADLSEQSLDSKKYEIIFIDDHSSDDTFGIIDHAQGKNRNFTLLRNRGHGKKRAIHTGITEASGDYIVTTDGDCRLSSGWLEEIYTCIRNSNADMIIGAVDITDTGRLFNRFISLEHLGLQAVTRVFAGCGKPVMCNAANLCFRNPGPERYLEMVKSNLNSGDDIFMMESIKKQGGSFIWMGSEKGTVMTKGPDTLKGLVKQRIRWTSKSHAYTDPVLTGMAVLVFLTNTILAVSLAAAVFIPGILTTVVFMFLMKSVPDLLLLADSASDGEKMKLLYVFIPAQIVYPFYVTVTGTAGFVKGLFFSPQNR